MKTKMTKQLFSLILLLLFSVFAKAQVDPAIIWQRTFGGSRADAFFLPNEMKCSTSDGGYILGIASHSGISGNKTVANFGQTDCWVVKIDANGLIQWQKSIGGSLFDNVYAIEQTSDGGYIVGCSSMSDISGNKTENSKGYLDYWIIKLDALGNISWQKTYGGASEDNLNAIHQTTDGGYIVSGISRSPISGDKTEDPLQINDADFWVLKLDVLGNIQWQNTINSLGSEFGGIIIQTNDGGYLLGGSSSANISGDKTVNTNGTEDYWVLKLDNLGNIQWQNTLGGNDIDWHYCMIQSSDGGYVLGGTSNSPNSGNKTSGLIGYNDYWMVKLDDTGNLMWDKTYGGNDGSSYLFKIQQLSDGGYLLGGESNARNILGNKSEDTKGDKDYWIVKTDSLGNVVWDNVIGADSTEEFAHIEITNDGNIFVVGASRSNISSDKTSNDIGYGDVWVLKLKMPTHVIYGSVFYDANSNCNRDTVSEPGRQNKIIKDHISGNSTITNSLGNYSFAIYNNQALLEVSNLLSFENISCLSSDSIYVLFDSTSSIDTFNVNYPISGPLCQYMTVDINSSLSNSCRYSTYYLSYSNIGFDTAIGAVIYVIVDTSVLDSFSSSTPFTQTADTLLFSIGNLAPDQSGTISFTTYVNCGVVIGTSTCAQAYIYPQTDCFTTIVGYDSSDIYVSTTCSNDTVHVEIMNKVGAQDMTSPGRIVAIEDEIIQQIDPFILNAGISVNYDYYVNPDRTLTIKVEQSPKHPTRPILIMHDELCALSAPIKLNSVINNFPRYDDAPLYEEVCSRIITAYDPNMKSVVPQGYTSQHYTDSNQLLEYRIDFQNTGLDTARKVVIIDTLSSWLDINTFVPLVSSHTYTTIIEGISTIKFIFDPISLPDSNVSEPNSHGFITFKIRPKYHTPKGTIINNFADIYFDYNTPVRTNTVFNTIYDTVLVRLGLGLYEPKENMEAHVLVFPNPTIDKFYIKLDQAIQNAQIKLVDMNGREVYEMNHVNGTQIEMKAIDLSKGIYFINIYDKNKMIARSKIVIR